MTVSAELALDLDKWISERLEPVTEGEERKELVDEEIPNSIRKLAKENGLQCESEEDIEFEGIDGKVLRKRFVLSTDSVKIIVTVHDPLTIHRDKIPAESVFGSDYFIEKRLDSAKDKSLFVQMKTKRSSRLKPKQYSAFGLVYSFGQYLINPNREWEKRIQNFGRYTTNIGKMNHNEFIFVKYNSDLCYIPVNRILKDNKVPSDCNTGKPNFFGSRSDFFKAFSECEIGLEHLSQGKLHKKKDNILSLIAQSTYRRIISIVELDEEELAQIQIRTF